MLIPPFVFLESESVTNTIPVMLQNINTQNTLTYSTKFISGRWRLFSQSGILMNMGLKWYKTVSILTATLKQNES